MDRGYLPVLVGCLCASYADLQYACDKVKDTYLDPVTCIEHPCAVLCSSAHSGSAFHERCLDHCPGYYGCMEQRPGVESSQQPALPDQPTDTSDSNPFKFGVVVDDNPKVILGSVLTTAAAFAIVIIVGCCVWQKCLRWRGQGIHGAPSQEGLHATTHGEPNELSVMIDPNKPQTGKEITDANSSSTQTGSSLGTVADAHKPTARVPPTIRPGKC